VGEVVLSSVRLFEGEKGEQMKSVSASICKAVLVCVLFLLVFIVAGCSTAQLGETSAEGNRRHARNLRIDQSTMMSDIDMVLLTDKPSKLTDKRIP
jgi:hypothetical protein